MIVKRSVDRLELGCIQGALLVTDSTVVKLRWLNELCDDFMHLESLGKHYLLQVLAQSRPLSQRKVEKSTGVI